MLQSPIFWLALAFLITFTTIFIPIFKIIKQKGNTKSMEIQSLITETENFAKNTAITAQARKKYIELLNNDKTFFLKKVEEDTQFMKAEHLKQLKNISSAREKEMNNRLALIEKNALQKMQKKISNFVLEEAKQQLKNKTIDMDITCQQIAEKLEKQKKLLNNNYINNSFAIQKNMDTDSFQNLLYQQTKTTMANITTNTQEANQKALAKLYAELDKKFKKA